MANTKRQKKYDPTKRSRLVSSLSTAQAVGTNPAVSIIGQVATMTPDDLHGELLPPERIDMISIAALSALDTLQAAWCPHAFRALTHWYRVLNYMGQLMERQSSLKASGLGKIALDQIGSSTEDAPRLSDDQYRKLRVMCWELISMLRHAPEKTLDMAIQASVERFTSALLAEYQGYHPLVHQILPALMRGSSLKSVLPAGADEKQVREHVKGAGWVLHGLAQDSCLYGMPQNLAELRSLRRVLMPVWERIDRSREAANTETKLAA